MLLVCLEVWTASTDTALFARRIQTIQFFFSRCRFTPQLFIVLDLLFGGLPHEEIFPSHSFYFLSESPSGNRISLVLASLRQLYNVDSLIPSSPANWLMDRLCGGIIFCNTAPLRSGEYRLHKPPTPLLLTGISSCDIYSDTGGLLIEPNSFILELDLQCALSIFSLVYPVHIFFTPVIDLFPRPFPQILKGEILKYFWYRIHR